MTVLHVTDELLRYDHVCRTMMYPKNSTQLTIGPYGMNSGTTPPAGSHGRHTGDNGLLTGLVFGGIIVASILIRLAIYMAERLYKKYKLYEPIKADSDKMACKTSDVGYINPLMVAECEDVTNNRITIVPTEETNITEINVSENNISALDYVSCSHDHQRAAHIQEIKSTHEEEECFQPVGFTTGGVKLTHSKTSSGKNSHDCGQTVQVNTECCENSDLSKFTHSECTASIPQDQSEHDCKISNKGTFNHLVHRYSKNIEVPLCIITDGFHGDILGHKTPADRVGRHSKWPPYAFDGVTVSCKAEI